MNRSPRKSDILLTGRPFRPMAMSPVSSSGSRWLPEPNRHTGPTNMRFHRPIVEFWRQSHVNGNLSSGAAAVAASGFSPQQKLYQLSSSFLDDGYADGGLQLIAVRPAAYLSVRFLSSETLRPNAVRLWPAADRRSSGLAAWNRNTRDAC